MSKALDVLCNVCGGCGCQFFMKGRDRLYHLPGEFDLWRCGSCGLLFIYPYLDERTLGSYYPQNYYSYSDSEKSEQDRPPHNRVIYYLAHPLKALNALFYSKLLGHNRDEKVSVGAHVLDVGCGDGRYLLKKSQEGGVCFGVDISREAVDSLKKKMPGVTVFCGNLWDAGFPSGFFDLINLCNVIEHVQPTDKLLSEIMRLLKPGGRLRMQTPNTDSLTYKIFRKYWMALDTPRHVYVFSRRNLKMLFEREDFEIVSVRVMENSFSLIGGCVYVSNAILNKKYKLMELEGLWNNEALKLLILPYVFLVNFFAVGDCIEFILKKKVPDVRANQNQ